MEQVPLNKMRFIGEGSDGFKYLSDADTESPVSKAFAESLVLSDSAKKFVLGREVGRLESTPSFYLGCFSSVMVLTTYNLARLINKKMELFKKPPLVRGSMYNLLGLVMGLLYFVGKVIENM